MEPLNIKFNIMSLENNLEIDIIEKFNNIKLNNNLIQKCPNLQEWILLGKKKNIIKTFPKWNENLYYILTQTKDDIKNAIYNIDNYKNNRKMNKINKIALNFFKDYMNYILKQN